MKKNPKIGYLVTGEKVKDGRKLREGTVFATKRAADQFDREWRAAPAAYKVHQSCHPHAAQPKVIRQSGRIRTVHGVARMSDGEFCPSWRATPEEAVQAAIESLHLLEIGGEPK